MTINEHEIAKLIQQGESLTLVMSAGVNLCARRKYMRSFMRGRINERMASHLSMYPGVGSDSHTCAPYAGGRT